ncbi:microsomal glutathione S-transferase 1-like isoform X2 [Styela clava]|uniref:microsomal glutathione S-transferase 1-like isoform X1 n=1 Tax=Styela clava TaxID=7725 RepID=UPI00193A4F1D|nr:microsomal glutathione S-transferase 1-like isoform X1 [Styela clava]
MSVFTTENDSFVALIKYGSLILFKMVMMSTVTSVYRVLHRSLTSEEDAYFAVGNNKEKQKKLLIEHPDVKRARLAHQNDLENIVPFFLISLLYISIKPEPKLTEFLFKVFAGSRILHSFVYIGKVRQPARYLTFLCGFLINVYMLVQIFRWAYVL